MNIFFEIGLVIILATIGATISKIIRQPKIPAYIIIGVIIGPGLQLITNTELISTLSEIGIAFLLFLVGLELELKKLRSVGWVSGIGGALQTFSVFMIGYFVAQMMMYSQIQAMYLGLIVTFSSTMVAIKLLADKKELNTLHGKIVIGILLVQDIIAILLILILTSLSQFSGGLVIPLFIIKALAITVVTILLSKYAFPYVFKFAASSRELLFLMSISICFLFAFIFHYMGFSIIIGAFVAGVALGNLPYNLEIISRVTSLRDFFAILFFVSLGLNFMMVDFSSIILPLVIFTIAVVFVKPLVIMVITSFFGFSKRTSFFSGMSLAQVSEFSLIIVAIGLEFGHISHDLFSLVTLLTIITIALTSYFIKFNNFIYNKFSSVLSIFNIISRESRLDYIPHKKTFDVILCGYDNIGYSIFKKLKHMRKSFIVVDYNPDVIKRLRNRRVPCMYGDLGDIDTISRLDFKDAKIIISTVPNANYNKLLLKTARAKNQKSMIFVTSDDMDQALDMYNLGADYVILPHFLGAEHVSVLLEDLTADVTKILNNKLNHITELKKRLRLGHAHPRRNHHGN
ncbi:hypothetical protein HN419_04780 [Candidatus Woesearchaeota archaeon]|jgi:Kef-type K+ transport system membrane component KefB|nr:hypothetical protein [Candidatus Woesearchaeota archaeon]MBT3537809.1 hypothetical protein [Candidatus Woesearchaeota archaeon]MBT4697940.1 hypothetical protein [Candidatus Woesearchaeota archaeon]MBT7105478.1 hypothetical protein [Candidatus Woesearchaeota archaeon]MBT7931668.1 hypothetical protein [Candidatus Woesearchaeota archaeon]